MNLNDRRGRGGKQKRKKGKEGGREDPKEPFGWSFSLLRDIRNQYSKMVFGKEPVKSIELQCQFKPLLVVNLNREIVIK